MALIINPIAGALVASLAAGLSVIFGSASGGGSSAAPADINGATHVDRTATGIAGARGLDVLSNGTTVYAVTDSGFGYKYTLSSTWDFSTASRESGSEDFRSVHDGTPGIDVDDDETICYTFSEHANEVATWDFGTPGDHTSLTATGDILDISSQIGGTAPRGGKVANGGTEIYIGNRNGNEEIHQWTMSVANDLTTATFTGSVSPVTWTTDNLNIMTGPDISDDGTKVYITMDDGSPNKVKVAQATMSTPFLISTATPDGVEIDSTSLNTTGWNVRVSDADTGKLCILDSNSFSEWSF